ncbi:hypothetical protein IGI04_036326 [Brassica rapa subsp. trilocularis]|uniref:Uncharacterized protein n=1 Tax=Brassica rapa subsp. trilocularis TaxID=1813537 RepID=A0ABQ7LE51_BRACM|nr:hypothetical protein IGI04_036326 [Brassica rapa subsp. trilocularis]
MGLKDTRPGSQTGYVGGVKFSNNSPTSPPKFGVTQVVRQVVGVDSDVGDVFETGGLCVSRSSSRFWFGELITRFECKLYVTLYCAALFLSGFLLDFLFDFTSYVIIVVFKFHLWYLALICQNRRLLPEPVESSYFVSVFVAMRTTVTISNLVPKAAESAKEREREGKR